jgi:hypothetical protein
MQPHLPYVSAINELGIHASTALRPLNLIFAGDIDDESNSEYYEVPFYLNMINAIIFCVEILLAATNVAISVMAISCDYKIRGNFNF